MPHRRVVLLALALLVVAQSPILAQPPAPRPSPPVEAWFGAVVVGPLTASGSLTTEFGPWNTGHTRDGSAGQILNLAAQPALGLEGGMNWFFTPSLGLQVLVGFDASSLGGDNADYLATLAANPPYEQRFAWPDTTGTLNQWTVAINGVKRWDLGPRRSLSLSGGLAGFAASGSASSLGYTVGTFDPRQQPAYGAQHFSATVDLDRGFAAGADIGGSLEFAVGPHVAVVVDGRLFAGTPLRPAVRVTDVAPLDGSSATVVPFRAQGDLGGADRSISPLRCRLLIGLKLIPRRTR